MVGNHKFNSIEKLKMSRAEEYDYDKFLSDSSDEYPKYEDLVKKDTKVACSGIDDYWFYHNAFDNTRTPNEPQSNALSIVLQLAKDHIFHRYGSDLTRGETISKEEELARNSIKVIEKRIIETNIILAKEDKK